MGSWFILKIGVLTARKARREIRKRGNGTWWLQADTSPFILHWQELASYLHFGGFCRKSTIFSWVINDLGLLLQLYWTGQNGTNTFNYFFNPNDPKTFKHLMFWMLKKSFKHNFLEYIICLSNFFRIHIFNDTKSVISLVYMQSIVENMKGGHIKYVCSYICWVFCLKPNQSTSVSCLRQVTETKNKSTFSSS